MSIMSAQHVQKMTEFNSDRLRRKLHITYLYCTNLLNVSIEYKNVGWNNN